MEATNDLYSSFLLNSENLPHTTVSLTCVNTKYITCLDFKYI
jgi:hypothetical protein